MLLSSLETCCPVNHRLLNCVIVVSSYVVPGCKAAATLFKKWYEDDLKVAFYERNMEKV